MIEFVGLNPVYDRLDPSISGTWVEDGAFYQSALKQGIESHIPAFSNIVHELKKIIADENGTLSGIASNLWSNGHPMLVDRI